MCYFSISKIIQILLSPILVILGWIFVFFLHKNNNLRTELRELTYRIEELTSSFQKKSSDLLLAQKSIAESDIEHILNPLFIKLSRACKAFNYRVGSNKIHSKLIAELLSLSIDGVDKKIMVSPERKNHIAKSISQRCVDIADDANQAYYLKYYKKKYE